MIIDRFSLPGVRRPTNFWETLGNSPLRPGHNDVYEPLFRPGVDESGGGGGGMKMGSDTPLLRHTTLMTVHCRRCDLRAGRDSDQPRRIREFLLSAIVNYFTDV